MKTKRWIVGVLLAASLLAGCANLTAIYEDDQRITADADSFHMVRAFSKIVNDNFKASVGKMEGMDTIWIYEAGEAEDLDITYTIQVSSGKLKLVWIGPEGEASVIVECEGNSAMESVQDTLHVESGRNRVKIVAAEDKQFEIELSIPEGEFQSL